MDAYTFADQIAKRNRESGDPIEDRYIDQAIGEWLRRGDPMQSRGHVQGCLARARAFEEENGRRLEIVTLGDEESKVSGAVPSDPATAILAARLFDDLEPKAAELRRQLFDGNPDVPFPNWDDAFDWLRQEEARGVRPPDHDRVCREYKDKIRRLCEEYRKSTGEMWSLSFPNGILQYLPHSGNEHRGINTMAVRSWYKRLWPLLEFVLENANRTGLGGPSILAFVLSGQRSWPKVSLSAISSRSPEGIRFTTITIPNPTPSWKDLEYIYGELRKMRDSKKGLSEVNRSLVAAIGEAEKFPERRNGRMKFWEDVAAKVCEDLELDAFTGRMAAKRFARLPKEIRESVLPNA